MKTTSLLAYMALTANAQGPIDVVPAPTWSTFPFTQSKHPVVIHLTQYPEENSWKITGLNGTAAGITCSRKTGDYDGHFGEQPAETCDLKQGGYRLDCLDDYHDGWHGGHMVIDGKRYCEDFLDGHKKTTEFSICNDALPITQH